MLGVGSRRGLAQFHRSSGLWRQAHVGDPAGMITRRVFVGAAILAAAPALGLSAGEMRQVRRGAWVLEAVDGRSILFEDADRWDDRRSWPAAVEASLAFRLPGRIEGRTIHGRFTAALRGSTPDFSVASWAVTGAAAADPDEATLLRRLGAMTRAEMSDGEFRLSDADGGSLTFRRADHTP